MRVATHNGSFHADDVFAVAALTMLGEPVSLVRTRDPELMAACNLRVDVGLRSDAATGDFDHHQAGGAGERPNGIRYASFGLVWKHYGERICGSAEIAERIDQKLVQVVDGHDNGQTLFESGFEDMPQAPTVDRVIALFNPPWDTDPGEEDYLRQFDHALGVGVQIIAREREVAQAQLRSADAVRQAISRADDPRLIALERGMPWREVVVNEAPDAQFVLFPRPDGWALQAVPAELGAFANRRDLPAGWAGKSGPELAEVTGVTDAVFCHRGRFFAAAASREGALALAALALADN